MNNHIDTSGLDALIQRMQRFPRTMKTKLNAFGNAVLEAMWESVPPYPPKPAKSKYIRTERLGKSLGSGFSGGKGAGRPDIYRVVQRGGWVEYNFGSRVKYAPYVIGDPQSQQAGHMRHWWTLVVDVVNRAMPKVDEAKQALAAELAQFLAGRGN